MKKYILFSAAALLLASCSKDSDVKEVEKDALTPVTIAAETGMANDETTTRAMWLLPQESSEVTNIHVTFEGVGDNIDAMDVYELGYSDKQTFTDVDKANYQSANFGGSWHKNGTRWAAVFPAGNANSVEVGETGNKYNLTIPSEQWTVENVYTTTTMTTTTENHAMSPDRNANVMVGSKDSHSTATCFLSPVCAYLYFATDPNITTVKIKTTGDNPLVGNFTVGTGVNKEVAGSYEWDGWENFVKCIKTITLTSNVSKEITVHGKTVTRKDSNNKDVTYCEYVACVFPTTYTDLSITKTDGTAIKSSTKSNTFDIVNLYYLGYFKTAE